MIKSRVNNKFSFQRRSKSNLKKLLELYEYNYLKIMNLLPDIKGPLLMSFKLPEGKKNSEVTLEISVNSQYTSTLKITQTNSSILPFKDIQLEILIYHDFKMVEVKRFNKKRIFWPRYSYPNKLMFSKDEKYQWNKFFSEWLNYSKNEGLSDQQINIHALK